MARVLKSGRHLARQQGRQIHQQRLQSVFPGDGHHSGQQFAATNTPQQIGVSKRVGRTLCAMVRCMRVDSGLPPFLWGGAHDGHVVHLHSDRAPGTRSTPTIQLKGEAQGKDRGGGGRGGGETKEGEGVDQPNQREHPVVTHPKGQDESSQTS